MATGRLPDPNTAPVTAKGDLYTYSTVPAKLAVGSDGETLVADSSATTGLRWQGNYAAGKNAIINGDFNIWQRGTSFSPPGAGSYTSDRWRSFYGTAVPTTYVVTRETFTPGSEPVSGYNSPYFWRGVLTTVGAATEVGVQQRIENVYTFANTTVTISFYAKSDSNRTQTVNFQQNFGSGGSSTVGLTAQTITTTSSWQRFSLQFSIPSISGKTIGANSYLQATISQNLTNGNTLDLWGIQVEAGSVATPFQTATGTLAGELAACRRYLPMISATNTEVATGYSYGTNQAIYQFYFDVPARVAPTGITLSGNFNGYALNTPYAITPVFNGASQYGATLVAGSGLTITAGQGSRLATNGTATILFTGCEL